MSATRDKNQKVTFVYSNLYQLYKKGMNAATAAPEAIPAQTPVDAVVPAKVEAIAEARQEVVDASEEARRETIPNTQVLTASAREQLARGLTSGQVLKSATAQPARRPAMPAVNEYRPAELIGKRIQKNLYEPILHKRAEQMGLSPRTLTQAPVRLTRVTNDAHQATLQSLRKNMNELNDLHDRLKFMLQELEDLVKG